MGILADMANGMNAKEATAKNAPKMLSRPDLTTRKLSYNYCGICGHSPKSNGEPNYTPIKWWDADDGWKIGTLCRWCVDEYTMIPPHPTDYAYSRIYNIDDANVNTDEDPNEAL